MPSFVRFSEDVARFPDTDRRMLKFELHEAADGSDIDFDKDGLTGESQVLGFPVTHDWLIEDGDDAYLVTEKVSIDKRWYLFLLGAVVAATVGALALSMTSLWNIGSTIVRGERYWAWLFLERLGFALVFTGMAAGTLCLFVTSSCPNLLPKTRGVNEGIESSSPWNVPQSLVMGVLLFAGAGVLLSSPPVLILAGVSGIMISWKLYFDRESFNSVSRWVEPKFNSLRGKISTELGGQDKKTEESEGSGFVVPVVAGEYVLSAVVPMLAPTFLILCSVWFGVLGFYLGGIGVIGFSQFQLYTWPKLFSDESALDAYFSVEQNQRQACGTSSQVIWFLLTIGVSYVLLGVLVGILLFFRQALVDPLASTAITGIVFASIWMILYYVTGLVYQTVVAAKQYVDLLFKTSSIDHDFETTATVLQIDSEKVSPYALSTGFSSYIVIPSNLLGGGGDSLDQRELEAIVAHEEKHILEREALLSFWMPVLSLLLFTGQNVIYGLLDFHEREFRADQYAKEKVGETAVISALSKLDQGPSSPGQDGSSDKGWWQEYFGLFFGTFAQSKAHPPVEDRKERLSTSD